MYLNRLASNSTILALLLLEDQHRFATHRLLVRRRDDLRVARRQMRSGGPRERSTAPEFSPALIVHDLLQRDHQLVEQKGRPLWHHHLRKPRIGVVSEDGDKRGGCDLRQPGYRGNYTYAGFTR